MSLYLGFAFASLILALTPGPDMLMVMALAAREGLKPALLFICGLVTGVWFHTFLLLLGVSALIMALPGALGFMATFGALYLLYLAFATFRERHQSLPHSDSALNTSKPNRSRYWRGVIMNISNPKVLLFFLAFFPQFAQLDEAGYQVRMLILALIFILTSFAAFALVAWLTARIGQKQLTKPRYKFLMDWFSIAVFVFLAMWIFITLVI
ncbi:threonine transporter RhtB [Marinicella pacifica]|uniref:Threonine transporter RhtB n=1 Tax=Marinicella pacifica TaxID=1171543 RepID=A0A917CHY4_9GAMM|nr:LysE family translocator [Marinicella pacifica]GGF89399.1 threonine transporter RhtB [Marinicella pacifica]